MRNYVGVIILGFGGHARSVVDVLLTNGISNIIFVEATAHSGENFLGHPVVMNCPDQLPTGWGVIAAAGNGLLRKQQLIEVKKRYWPIATVISPTATIGAGAVIEPGSFVGHHAHVGPLALIGESCIINTGCIIEHDCKIGAFTHISINTAIAGYSEIGSHCFIGAGATVIDKIKICKNVTVGAGSVIVKPVTQAGTYMGVPAKLLPSLQIK